MSILFFMRIALDNAVCRTDGAAAAAACSLWLDLHSHKSCTALLLLLYLCMLYIYGFLFVVGLPLLLISVVNTFINMLAMSSQRPSGPIWTRF